MKSKQDILFEKYKIMCVHLYFDIKVDAYTFLYKDKHDKIY